MGSISIAFILLLSLVFCSAISIDKLTSRTETSETNPLQQSTDLNEIANIVGATLLKDSGLSGSPMIQMLPGVMKMLPQLLGTDLGQQMISTALQSQVSGVIGPLLSQVLSPEIASSQFVSDLTHISGDRIGSAVKLLEQVAGPSFKNIMSLANQVGTSLLSTTHEVVTGSVAVGLGLTVLSYIIQYVSVIFGTEINLIDSIRGEMALDAPEFTMNLANALDKYN